MKGCKKILESLKIQLSTKRVCELNPLAFDSFKPNKLEKRNYQDL